MSLGVFCSAVAGQVYYDKVWRYRYDEFIYDPSSWSSDQLLVFFVMLGLGAFLLTSALGLIFRKNWARLLMQFGFIVAALAWLAFVSSEINSIQHAPVIFIGITTAVLGCVIGALLFLNNADWVLPYLRKAERTEERTQVLDQDLWE